MGEGYKEIRRLRNINHTIFSIIKVVGFPITILYLLVIHVRDKSILYGPVYTREVCKLGIGVGVLIMILSLILTRYSLNYLFLILIGAILIMIGIGLYNEQDI